MSQQAEIRHFTLLGKPAFHVLPEEQGLPQNVPSKLEPLGFRMFKVDAGQVSSREQLFDALSAALDFPDYFGRNWDALLDLLGTLDWVPARGYLLVVERIDEFVKCCGEDFGVFADILADALQQWRINGVPFHVVLTGSQEVPRALESVTSEPICNHWLPRGDRVSEHKLSAREATLLAEREKEERNRLVRESPGRRRE